MPARLNDVATEEAVYGVVNKDKDPYWLRNSILKQLRIIDEQQNVNAGKWTGIPYGLNAELIERVLYYHGEGVFFYSEKAERFMFLPFAGEGGIDVYGRFNKAKPLPFMGSSNDEKQKEVLSDVCIELKYDVQIEDMTMEDFSNSGVILRDYARQMSQKTLPRQMITEPILELEASMLPYCKTALMNATGVAGMRVGSRDEESNVKAASQSIERCALTGQKWAAIIGNVDFQDLTDGAPAKAEEFLLAMQSVDNFRQSFHGLNNGGVYEKDSYRNLAQTQLGQGSTSLIMDDRTRQRQEFCTLVNSIWGIGMWYQPSETVLGSDTNFDGSVSNDQTSDMIKEGNNDGMEQ